MAIKTPMFVTNIRLENRLLEEFDLVVFFNKASGRLHLIAQRKGQPLPVPDEAGGVDIVPAHSERFLGLVPA